METSLIYAILFLNGNEGIEIDNLAARLKLPVKEMRKEVKAYAKSLEENHSPVVIKWNERNVRFVLAPEVKAALIPYRDKNVNVKLSQSLLETLTIIAYNQPTTRSKIEQIRGTNSDYAFYKLLEYDLIKCVGKAAKPGNPNLYATTNKCLEHLNINKLKELPELDQLDKDIDLLLTNKITMGV